MKANDHNPRALFKFAAKSLLGATVIALIARAMVPRWAEIAETASTVNPMYVAASAAAYFIYTFLNAGIWSQVLSALGHSLNPARSARIWVMTEALRWLPGGIWGYCSRVLEAGRHGIPKAIGSLSLTVEIVLTVAAWCTAAAIGALLSPLLGQLLATIPAIRIIPIGLPLLTLAASAVAIFVYFPNFHLSRIVRETLHKTRAHCGARLRSRHLLYAFGAYLALCLLQGVALLLIVRSLGISEPPTLLLLTAVNAIAWLTGFFAIGVPAGIGVREVALVAGLALSIPLEVAVCAAAIWRAVQIAVEPLCLGTCIAVGSTHRRLSGSPARPATSNL